MRRIQLILIAPLVALLLVGAPPAVAVDEPPLFEQQTGSLDGDYLVGGTMTVTAPEWVPSPELSYQWFIGDTPIPGATDSSYTIQPEDIGWQGISVEVTGTLPGYQPAVSRLDGGMLGWCEPYRDIPVSGSGKVGTRLQASEPACFARAERVTWRWVTDYDILGRSSSWRVTRSAFNIGLPVRAEAEVIWPGGTLDIYVSNDNELSE